MFRRARRRGSSLVEFALVALVSYLLIAAVLTFGSILWIGNVLQQAVDVGAQEIARMPYQPDAEFGLGQIDTSPAPGSVMLDPEFRQLIYDETDLVIPKGALGDQMLSEYARDNLPLINRLLVTVYIFDPNYGDDGAYRYPGAIVTNDDGDPTVLIPVVDYSAGNIRWIAPVEEMLDVDGVGPFNMLATSSSPNFIAGTVALRINYPYQSASMSGFGEPSGTAPHRGNIGNPISADDTIVESLPGAAPPGSRYSLVVPTNDYVDEIPNINAGRYGLGRQMALPFENVRQFGVRPYRRIISAQAIYRREVFE